MYADDVVLLSSSKSCLQNCINNLEQFPYDSKMPVNLKKKNNKIIELNKAALVD